MIRVLLIDDAPSFRVLLRHLLAEEGDIVVAGEAGDAREGIRLAGELRPDVVLTDVHLGADDGLAAVGDLRAAAPGAKVIVLSGSSPASVGEVRAGVDAFVEKTAGAAEVRDVVRRLAAAG